MSNRKKEPKFELQRVSNPPNMANIIPMTPFSPGKSQNRPEQYIHDESRLHMGIMQAKVIESQYALQSTAYLHLHSFSIFKQTVNYIIEERDSVELDEARSIVDKFCMDTLEDLGTRHRGINEVASANIAYTIHRDHYPPDESFEKKGIFARLIGA